MYSKGEYVVVLSIDEIGKIIFVNNYAKHISYDIRLLDGSVLYLCDDADIRPIKVNLNIADLSSIMDELDILDNFGPTV